MLAKEDYTKLLFIPILETETSRYVAFAEV
jgi:hypothetical protein